jgi:hypothetical protein
MKLARLTRAVGITCTFCSLCLCNIPLVHAESITIDAFNSPTGDVIPPSPPPYVVNILEGAVVVGDVYGNNPSEPVTGNTINISGGSMAGDVLGGTYQGTVSGSNNVNISGGVIGGDVYGSKTLIGHISDSTGVHVSGGTISGSIYGAYTTAGNAARNSIAIEDDAAIAGGTTIYAAYGAFTKLGNATSNTINISSGTVGDAYSGYSMLGDVWSNVFNFSGGTINNIAGGYTLQGESWGNQVNLTGETGTINGDVSGGYSFSSEGVARDNIVSIDFNGTSSGMISGGRSDFGDTTDNEVSLKSGNVSGITGGYAIHGRTIGNTVTINGGFAQTVYGGYTVDGIVENNTVLINGATATIGTAAGGFNDLGNVSNNHVEIENVNGVTSIYGGQANQGNAIENTITVNGGTFTGGTIAGGYSSKSGNAINNEVTISGNSSGNADSVYGGWTKLGDATTNSVVIENGTTGVSTVAGGFSVSGAARNNTVKISNSGNFTSVYGGYAGYGDATGNTLELAGGRYNGTIAGGFSTSGSATGNTVTIYESAILNAGVLLYGGFSGSGRESRTGNTLNLKKPISVRGLDNFENYNFIVPPHFAANDTFVTVTAGNGAGGSIHLRGAQVMVGMEEPNTNLRSGDTIILIDEKGGYGFDGNPANSTSNGASVGLLDYEFDISVVENQLLANITSAKGSPETTSLSEGFVSGVILANQGADAIAGPSMDSAIASVHSNGKTGYGGFGSLVAGQSRYKMGSHVDMLGISAAAGLAYGVNYEKRYITLGPFLEYGKGDYDTYSQTGEQEIRGNGDTEYMGGGFLFRWDEKDAGRGRYFAEASLRVGRLKNYFSSNDLHSESEQPVIYDSSAMHYGAHFGYGGSWGLSTRTGLEGYGKYFYERGESDAVALSSGEPIDFDSVTSQRLRGGARLSFKPGQQTVLYIGGAYEHQLDGWVKANIYSYAIDAPVLSGGTGIGEFTMSYRPSANSNTSINVGVQGFGGKRQGVAGNVFIRF